MYALHMSVRKTKKWTENLEDAYYNPKGRAGELAIMEHLRIAGCNPVDWESNQDVQQRGIDITYTNEWGVEVSVQVKQNYVIEAPVVPGAPSAQYFYVEAHTPPKHIKCVEASVMVHVNVENQCFVTYPTKLMVEAVEMPLFHKLTLSQSRGVALARIPDKKFDWLTRGRLLTLSDE